MSSYRDDLGAARLRIDTLEAKVREGEAALAARDAELVERDAELARLRVRLGDDHPAAECAAAGSPWRALVLGAALLSATLGSFHLYVSDPCVHGVDRPDDQGDVEDDAVASTRPHPVPVALEMDPVTTDADGTSEDVPRSSLLLTRAKLRGCYRVELLTRPEFTETLSVTLDVAPDGHVRDVELSPSSDRSTGLDACIVRAFREASFRDRAGPSTVVVPVVLASDVVDTTGGRVLPDARR